MILIIDAYNVLKTMGNMHFVPSAHAQEFIARLSARAQLRAYTVFIVFDGGVGGRGSAEQIVGGMVYYTGADVTADDMICDLLQEYRGHELVVVSADRALRSRSSKSGAKLLEPAVIWRVLYPPIQDRQASVQRHSALAPLTDMSTQVTCLGEDLAKLLAAAPIDQDKEEGTQMDRQRTCSGYTASKTVKQLRRIVERL